MTHETGDRRPEAELAPAEAGLEPRPQGHTGPEAEASAGDGDPRARGTLIAAVVGTILILVIVLILQAFFYDMQDRERAVKVVANAPEELGKLRATQLQRISEYRWVDPGAKRVAIPIERAMELTVRDQGRLPGGPAPGGGAGSPAASGAASGATHGAEAAAPASGSGSTPSGATGTAPGASNPSR